MKTDEQVASEEKSKFLINSSYQGFNDRQKSVFDKLNVVEHDTKDLLNKHEPVMDVDEPPDPEVDREDVGRFPKKEMKHFRGRDSIFKRPQARPPRSIPYRKTPDYQVNPHKWTRYSLDIPSEDMSERANTAAAMSFLKEMELRKQQDEDLDDDADLPHKIVFKKAPAKKVPDTAGAPPVVFRNSKVVMPEYVVGEKIKKEQKQKKKVEGSNTAKEVKLDHLFEDEDD